MADFTMSGELFLSLEPLVRRRALVYGWKRGNEFLYIGASRNGICRLVENHHVIGKKGEVQDTDEFCFWLIPENMKSVDQLETSLIAKFQPRFNKLTMTHSIEKLRQQKEGEQS